MRRLSLLVLAALLSAAALAGCNKHNVPLGGECEVGEDCDSSGLTCLKDAGAPKGICSKPCSIPPPGTTITTTSSDPTIGKTCEQAGLVCKKAETPHPILGEAYCAKK